MDARENKAKEKANELFNTYFPYADPGNSTKEWKANTVKIISYIVEEILQTLYEVNQSNTYWIQEKIDELQEVKQELNKL